MFYTTIAQYVKWFISCDLIGFICILSVASHIKLTTLLHADQINVAYQ